MPDGATEIKKMAFFWCASLTSIVIPDSVTTIGEGAFKKCSSLTTASIPSGATLKKDSDGNGPFFKSPTTVTTRR